MCLPTHRYPHAPIHRPDHHLIHPGTRGISTTLLQLFLSRSGYPDTTIPKAFTKGTRPTANQHTVALSTRPEQRRQLAAHPRYFEAMSILNLVATHLLQHTSCLSGARELVLAQVRAAHRIQDQDLTADNQGLPPTRVILPFLQQ